MARLRRAGGQAAPALVARPHAVFVGAVVASGLLVTGQALGQSVRSVRDGVYTEAQAERGRVAYFSKCEPCHGYDLQGQSTTYPSIGGRAFVGKWQGRTLGDVFAYIQENMPLGAAGSLDAQAYTDVIAYLLQYTRYPAGAGELPAAPTALRAVRVEPLP